jgi:hypothetical protein
MALKNTILGWLRQDPDKGKQERQAEANEVDREYGNAEADAYTDLRLGSGRDHFEDDESAPPRY